MATDSGDSAEALLASAKVSLSAKDWDAALLYGSRLAAAGQWRDGLAVHAKALLGAGRFAEATQAADALIAADSRDADAYMWKGVAAAGMGQKAESVDYVFHAARLNPSSPVIAPVLLDLWLAAYYRGAFVALVVIEFVGAAITGFRPFLASGLTVIGIALALQSFLGYWAFRRGMVRTALGIAAYVIAALVYVVSGMVGTAQSRPEPFGFS